MSSQIREQCTRCAIKHLGQARALMLETKKGYPHHVWYAMGHMAEAEDEIAEIQPEEAADIRSSRMEMEEALKRQEAFIPDFERLMNLVAGGGMLEEMYVDPKAVAYIYEVTDVIGSRGDAGGTR